MLWSLQLPMRHADCARSPVRVGISAQMVKLDCPPSSMRALPPSAPLQLSVLFLKPVQTGFPADSDARLVAAAAGLSVATGPHAAQLLPSSERQAGAASEAAAGGTLAKTLYAWQQPVSPHVAVETEGRPVSNRQVAAAVVAELQGFAAAGEPAGSSSRQGQIAIVETAGGVASPGPSGTLQASHQEKALCFQSRFCPGEAPSHLVMHGASWPSLHQPWRLTSRAPPCLQCDLLRPLRLPGILVGDGRLGGISATLSSYDALSLRGHSVPLVVLMEGPDGGRLGNAAAIQRHLRGRATVLSFPECLPPPPASEAGGAGSDAQQAAQQAQQIDANLAAWLEQSAPQFDALLGLAGAAHADRVRQLAAAAGEARSMLWWPFTQHGSVASDAGVTVIDSRAGESFCVYRPPAAAAAGSVASSGGAGSEAGSLDFQYDACASWWTQGVSCWAASYGFCGAPGHPATSCVLSDVACTQSVAFALGCKMSRCWTPPVPALRPRHPTPPRFLPNCADPLQVGESAQPHLVQAVAAAAARYGHVMFPENAHEPAVEVRLTHPLLTGRLQRHAANARQLKIGTGAAALDPALNAPSLPDPELSPLPLPGCSWRGSCWALWALAGPPACSTPTMAPPPSRWVPLHRLPALLQPDQHPTTSASHFSGDLSRMVLLHRPTRRRLVSTVFKTAHRALLPLCSARRLR